MTDKRDYDVVVLGGGPGGYTAAMYAARSGYSVAVVEKLSPGGQMATTAEVENYPGFDGGVDGYELGERMKKGAERFGAATLFEEAVSAELKQNPKKIVTSAGELTARAVVIATGAHPRELGVAGEKEMLGKGVAYCATCDGMRFKGKTVVVAGGGNSAAADALYLARICKKVYIVHRRDSMKASKAYADPLRGAVEFVWNSRIEEVLHGQAVTGVRIADARTGEKREIKCDGVFAAIGRIPNTDLFRGALETDEGGYIAAGEDTKTRIDGVFAVGDVRSKPLRQIVTATADGATAAAMIEEYLR